MVMADNYKICCLDGDGISKRADCLLCRCNEYDSPYLTKSIHLSHHQVGFSSLKAHGTTITEQVISAASESDGIILGPVSHADYPSVEAGGINPSGLLRTSLSLFANIRPSRCYSGLPHYTRSAFDIVIMRENLEGFYADRNMVVGGGSSCQQMM